MIQYINQLRSNAGIAPIHESCILDESAQDWADTIAYTGNFAHSGGDWIKVAHGYPANAPGWGENILWSGDSVYTAFIRWANSAPHLENMLDPTFTEAGLGISGGSTLWGVYVLHFGNASTSSCSAPQATVTPLEGVSTLYALNVRSAPSQSAKILGVLPSHARPTLLSGRVEAENHIWVYIAYKNLSGWVASEYIEGYVTVPYGEGEEAIVDIGEAPASPQAVEE